MLTAELEKVTISAETTVRTALQRLCENGQQILFVTENGILRGSLTDSRPSATRPSRCLGEAERLWRAHADLRPRQCPCARPLRAHGLRVLRRLSRQRVFVHQAISGLSGCFVQTAEWKWSKLPNGNDPNCRMAIDVNVV